MKAIFDRMKSDALLFHKLGTLIGAILGVILGMIVSAEADAVFIEEIDDVEPTQNED